MILYKPVDFANNGKDWAEGLFLENVIRDKNKNKQCEEKGIKLLYYIPDKDLLELCIGNEMFNSVYSKENVFENLESLNCAFD